MLIGAALAVDVALGTAALIALLYGVLVFVDLPVAIALWIALAFIEALPFLSVGPLLAAILIAFGWLATLRDPNSLTRVMLHENRRALTLLGAFVLWLVVSLAWARRPELAGQVTLEWAIAAGLFVIVATAINGRATARLVVAAFVGGAAVSVAIGLLGLAGTADPSTSALDAAGQANRLRGGSGDPNYLAAGLVPAIALAAALLVSDRRPWTRALLGLTIVLLTAGLAATESRGGLIAAVVALLVAFLTIRRRRVHLLAFVTAIVGLAALWFAVNPTAWDRISGFDAQGNGRSSLWNVGWRIAMDHPAIGVGLGNFPVEAPNYVRQPGQLEFVNLIAERPLVAHNVYLQMLAETGIVGTAIFLLLIAACLRSAWMAARLYERIGDTAMAALARGLVIAIAATLTSSFFISNSSDRRTWVLMALGPALLAIARRQADATVPRPPSDGAQPPKRLRRPRSVPTA